MAKISRSRLYIMGSIGRISVIMIAAGCVGESDSTCAASKRSPYGDDWYARHSMIFAANEQRYAR